MIDTLTYFPKNRFNFVVHIFARKTRFALPILLSDHRWIKDTQEYIIRDPFEKSDAMQFGRLEFYDVLSTTRIDRIIR